MGGDSGKKALAATAGFLVGGPVGAAAAYKATDSYTDKAAKAKQAGASAALAKSTEEQLEVTKEELKKRRNSIFQTAGDTGGAVVGSGNVGGRDTYFGN